MMDFEIINVEEEENGAEIVCRIREIQRHPFSIKKGIIDCIHQENIQHGNLSHRDETGLLMNGYLREIVLDVANEDIGFFFHKICCPNACSMWHLKYSLNFPID